MSKISYFITHFGSQNVNECQTLQKSARQHFIVRKIELEDISISPIWNPITDCQYIGCQWQVFLR